MDLDVAGFERFETEFENVIRRRYDERVATEGERPAEEAWAESVRVYNAKRRERNRWEWVRYFDKLAASLRARAEEYDQRAAKLLEDGRKENGNGHHTT